MWLRSLCVRRPVTPNKPAGCAIDRGVQEVIAPDGVTGTANTVITPVCLRVSFTGDLAEFAPAAAGGDFADFLDVDVDQLAGQSSLDPADDSAGRSVQPPQPSEPVSGQDSMHRGGMHAEQVTDPSRSPSAQATDFDDASFGASWGLVRAVVGAGAAIGHPCRTIGAVAIGPAFRGRRTDLEAFSRTPQRPLLLDDTTSQPQTASLRQRGITVNHEDLRDGMRFLDSSHSTRRSSFCHLTTPSPTSVVNTSSWHQLIAWRQLGRVS